MVVIGIDLGTTACKAGVFDGGLMLAFSSRPLSYSSPQDGWAEQDAESVWKLVSLTVKEALAQAGNGLKVRAVCVSVQGDAIIPIDASGNALHPAILGMDTRSSQEATDLEDRFGRGQLYASTGMPCEPLNAITKVWWLARKHPELKARLWKYTHYEDFLLTKIAGVPALDFTMASRTGAFDPVRKDWVPSILDAVGIRPSQLGNVSAPGVPIGIILGEVASDWGVDRNALVISGGHDQCMAAIGAGVVEPDLACYSMGTAEVISICFENPRLTAAMLANNYPCYCSALPDHYFTITLNQSGGLALQWFQSALTDVEAATEDARQQSYQRLLAGLELNPSLVLFLPHLVGSGTPACDHLSRGAFVGLSLKTGRRDMFQAVCEALAYEARLNLEALACLDVHVGELRAVGGGTRSEALLELKATVLNRPIRIIENPEAALLGTSMLAHVALGEMRDLRAARAECVNVSRTIEPRPGAAEQYSAAFERYRQVYGTLKSFYHNWRAECRTPAIA